LPSYIAYYMPLQTTIFGKKLLSPLILAPIGVQSIFHPDGEIASAAAAGKLKVPYALSTAATRTIEEVAEANGPGNERWFQLYWYDLSSPIHFSADKSAGQSRTT
jgi:lactate 2-monooxygenase